MIGFDIDGVIADFNSVFRSVILDEVGVDINDLDQTRFEIHVPGLTSRDVGDLVVKTINRFVWDMQPYPGVIEALWRLYDATREPIVFVTARKLITEEATKRWLDEYVVVPYTLFNGIRSAEKAQFLGSKGFTHFIDDRFRTVQEVKEYVPYTYLMSRPWNEGREAAGVYRTFDLNDYITDYLEWRNKNE